MKTLRYYQGKWVWMTELRVRIVENDLLNETKKVLKQYEKHHEVKPKQPL